MKVVTLVENQPAPGSGVSGEHGLSLLIEADGRRVLFDTGASGLLARNADALGLSEALADVNVVVLSHGHYDHTGGLAEVLRRARERVPVFIGPGLFDLKVNRKARERELIGAPLTRMEFEGQGARFVERQNPAEILPGFFVTGDIEPREQWEGTEVDLGVEYRGGSVVPDPFLEEQALAIRTDRGIVVFVGCAHRGLVNSIAAAQQAAGEERVRAVFGGAHLRSASRERIERAVDAVTRLEPELVALGHCTGRKAEERLARVLGECFRPLRAGARWTLG